MNDSLDVGALLRQLHEAGVEHILIGGLAVNAWGVIRSTKDIDICPSPDRENSTLSQTSAWISWPHSARSSSRTRARQTTP